MFKTDLRGIKDFIEIIKKTNLKKIVFLSIFLFFGGVVESLGLGLLYPIFDFLLNENSTKILDFEFNSTSNVIIFLFLIIGVIYTAKTIYLTFLTIKQNKFISFLTKNISNELFSGYLYNPYNFHLKNNSSQLVKNIQVELSNFTAYLSAIIFIISDSILLLAIIGTLIFLNPIGTFLLIIYLTITSSIFLFFTKKKINVWGQERLILDKKLALILTESLKGIKDLKISSLEPEFLKRYKDNNLKKFEYYWKQLTFGQIPRFYLELISIFGFIFFMLLTFYENKSLSTILPLATVYLAAFFRALPSLNRIISSYQQMIYYLPSVKLIKNEISYNRSNINKKLLIESFSEKILFKNVSFKYDEKYIFNNLNFEFKKGKIYGLMGQSGSGKSTLVSIVLGLLKPSSGTIIIDKQIVEDFKWSKILGYVSQNIFLFDATILENICVGIPISEINLSKVNEVLKKTNMYDYVLSLKNGLNHNLGENGTSFSGGQVQRLAIARALYKDPEILILDEVTSALDAENERDILRTLRGLDDHITIIIITHKKELLNLFETTYHL